MQVKNLLGKAGCHFAVEVDGLLGLLVPGFPWLDSFSSPFCFAFDFGLVLFLSESYVYHSIIPIIGSKSKTKIQNKTEYLLE